VRNEKVNDSWSQGEQIKENELNEASNTQRRHEKFIQSFIRMTRRKEISWEV